MAESSSLQAGLDVLKKLFGRTPDKGPLPEEFFDLTISHVYGQVWTRPGLTMEERAMITVAVLAAQGTIPELETHLKGAKHLGLAREKIDEVMIHVAHYAGWPMALQGFRSMERVYGVSKLPIKRPD